MRVKVSILFLLLAALWILLPVDFRAKTLGIGEKGGTDGLPDPHIAADGNALSFFDPQKARFAMDVCEDLLGREDIPYDNTLKKNGYEQIKRIVKGADPELEEKEAFWSSVNVSLGLKSAVHDGKERYTVSISFRGTSNMPDVFTDMMILHQEDIHGGVYKNAKAFYDKCGDILFEIGGQEISLRDMFEAAQYEDSAFSFLFSGYSLGGATACVFSGYFLTRDGVLPALFETYTFGTFKHARTSYTSMYQENNIFNIINADDIVPNQILRVTSDARIGNDIIFYSDETFRERFYGQTYRAGKGHDYYAGIWIVALNWFEPHKTYVYREVLNEIIPRLESARPLEVQ